jgi:hypothetical protein
VSPSSTPRPRRERWLLCGVLLLALLGGLAFLNPYLDSDGDNAGYIVLAKSIASGRGFTSINFPDYIPHTLYYPLYPLVLSPIVAAWPGNYLLPKLPSLLFTLVLVGAVWALFRPRTGGSLWTLGLLVAGVALNRHVAEHAAATMTEAQYLGLSFLALAWAERWESGAGLREGVVLGLFVAAATMTKPIGITLAAAVVLAWLLRRRWTGALAALLIVGLVAGGWAARNARIVTPDNAFANPTFGNTSYGKQILLRSPYRPEAGEMGLLEFLGQWPRRILSNFDRVARIAHPAYTVELFAIGRPTGASPLFAVPFIVLSLIGWILCIRGRPRSAELYMLFYLGAVTLYGAVRVRYVLPVMPLALFYLVRGVDAVVGAIRRRSVDVNGPAGAGGIAVLAAAVFLSVLLLARQARFSYQDDFGPRKAANLYDRVDMGSGSYFRAAEWLRDNTPPDAVIMGMKPWLAYLITGRHTTVFQFGYNQQDTIDILHRHRVDYVIEDRGWFWQSRQFLTPLIEAYPGAFTEVHREEGPETRVYRVDRSNLPPPRPSAVHQLSGSGALHSARGPSRSL